MVVIEGKHQLGRERPHPVVHDDRIVAVELLTVIHVIKRVIKVDRRLCRKHSRQTHIAVLAERLLRLLDQSVAEYSECVEVKFGIGISGGKIDWMLRTAKMIAIAAIEQFALGVGEVEEWGIMRFDIAQRHDVDVDVADLAATDRYLIAQIAFDPNPVVSGGFAHDYQQVVGRRIAVTRTTDQFPE